MKIHRLFLPGFSVDLIYDKDLEEIKVVEGSMRCINPKITIAFNETNSVSDLEYQLNASDIDYGILGLGARLVDLYPRFFDNPLSYTTRSCYVIYNEEKYFANISNKPRGRITGLTDFFRMFPNIFKKGSLIKYNLEMRSYPNAYTGVDEDYTVINIKGVYEKKQNIN